MKKIYLFFICFNFLISESFGKNITSIERYLVQIEIAINKTIQNEGNRNGIIDSLNEIKTKKILKYLKSKQKEINFKYLEENDIFQSVESKDKQFKILCWDTYTGGTTHIYESICVYTKNGKRYLEQLNNQKNEYKFYYEKIEEVRFGKKTYYLPIGFARISSGDFSMVIENYLIEENGKLKSESIFHAKKESLKAISLDYNFFENGELTDRQREFIICTKNKDVLKIGIIDKKGKFLNKFLKYYKKSDGYYYIKG